MVRLKYREQQSYNKLKGGKRMKKIGRLALIFCLVGALTACQPKNELDLNSVSLIAFYLGDNPTPADTDKLVVNDAELQQLDTIVELSAWTKVTTSLKLPETSLGFLYDSKDQSYILYDVSGDLILKAEGSNSVLYQAPKPLSDILSGLIELKTAVTHRTLIQNSAFWKANANLDLDLKFGADFRRISLDSSRSDDLKQRLDFKTWTYVQNQEFVDPTHASIDILIASTHRLYLQKVDNQAFLMVKKGSEALITYEIPLIVYASVEETIQTWTVVDYPGPSDQVKNAVYVQGTFTILCDYGCPELADQIKNPSFVLTSQQSELAKSSLNITGWVKTQSNMVKSLTTTYLTLMDTNGLVTSIGEYEGVLFALVTDPKTPSFLEVYRIPSSLVNILHTFALTWGAGIPNEALLSFSPETLSLLLQNPNNGDLYPESHTMSLEEQASVEILLKIESWRVFPAPSMIFCPGWYYKFTDSKGHDIMISDCSTLDSRLNMSTIQVVDLNPNGAKDVHYFAPISIIHALKDYLEPKYPRY